MTRLETSAAREGPLVPEPRGSARPGVPRSTPARLALTLLARGRSAYVTRTAAAACTALRRRKSGRCLKHVATAVAYIRPSRPDRLRCSACWQQTAELRCPATASWDSAGGGCRQCHGRWFFQFA